MNITRTSIFFFASVIRAGRSCQPRTMRVTRPRPSARFVHRAARPPDVSGHSMLMWFRATHLSPIKRSHSFGVEIMSLKAPRSASYTSNYACRAWVPCVALIQGFLRRLVVEAFRIRFDLSFLRLRRKLMELFINIIVLIMSIFCL